MGRLSVLALWPLGALLMLPVLCWWAQRSSTTLARSHRRLLLTLRGLTLVALALALAQPVWHRPSREISVVYALDVSRSVSDEFIRGALDWMTQANVQGKPAHAVYLPFADHPELLERLDQVAEIEIAGSGNDGGIDRGATDLERALEGALGGFSPHRMRRLVLMTDGVATQGDAWRVLPRLVDQRVRVFTYAAPPRAEQDAWVESIEAPDGVRKGEPVTVAVRVMAQAGGEASVSLQVDGRPAMSRRVQLAAGMNRYVFLAQVGREGPLGLRAEIHASGDTQTQNDRLDQSIWVAPSPRVLYVENDADAALYLKQALSGGGLEVDVIGPGALPTNLGALDRYDLVILSDVPAGALGVQRMQVLAEHVRERGGGLLFAAGQNTYGAQGYADSPLERVLPVDFRSQEKRKDLALVLALDRSFSMKGRKIELAKAAALATLELLEESNRFAVIAFDSQPDITVPLGQLYSKRRAEEQISRIQASGQTNIYPALQAAYYLLRKLEVKAKHVIVLTDGDTQPADFERQVKRMAEAGITVTTVAVGAEADLPLLRNIATWGNGRHYAVQDAAAVPQVFINETQQALRSTLVEEPFKPSVKQRAEALRGLDFNAAPALKGYASTRAKPTAEVLLQAEGQVPILSRWQYGLGKSVLFASDVKNRWAADWLKWDGYGKFWTQLARETMRHASNEELVLRVSREGSEALISLTALDVEGRFRNGLQPNLRVTLPDGATTQLGLAQIGPGRYQARAPLRVSGEHPYRFELLADARINAQDVRKVGSRALYFPYADEYRAAVPNLSLLQTLASETGGKFNAPVADIFADYGDRTEQPVRLWPALLVAALLFYLLDILVRRAAWFWQRLGIAPLRQQAGQTPERETKQNQA